LPRTELKSSCKWGPETLLFCCKNNIHRICASEGRICYSVITNFFSISGTRSWTNDSDKIWIRY